MTTSTVTPLLPAPDKKPMIQDAYREPITNPDITDVDSAARAFFETSPEWLERLMLFRNKVVARIGFAAVDEERRELPQRFEPGESVGAFGVLERSDDEIIMGGDDTHFGFRMSIWIPEGTRDLQITTIGDNFTALGRVYLSIVSPGHRLIAPMMARRTARGVG